MEFSNNSYVSVVDKTSGTGAFELLVDRYTGQVWYHTWHGAWVGQAGSGTVM